MAAGKKRGLSPFLVALEAALIAIGALCLGWYAGVRVAAAREQALLSRELESARELPAKAGSYEISHRSYADGAVVGRIEIPRLKLSAVAREGVDDRTLDLAVGHVPGTSLPGEPGNAAFAAHRDTFFRPLRHVHDGDIVVVTTPRGAHRYLVTSTRAVSPDDVSVLDATERPTLTLVTCYPFDFLGSAPYRFVVQAAELPASR
jgi:sortase A